MAGHRFETVLAAEDGGVFIEVPLDVPAVFGRARAPVRGTINGHPFRSTVAVYGGRYYLPVRRELREAAGVAAGDAVVVELEADEQPRSVDPPADLAGALAADPEAGVAFAGLSFTHQREYVEWVTGAKREETRRRRVEQAVAMLRDGRRHP
jgi:Bacteriocin-protection, YdeI or OmpD-Associated/Domain of unknown function (DUF1905)